MVILGALKGYVHAGVGGNRKSVVAAYFMQPEILQIGDIATRSPEDSMKPQYPEIAKIKGDTIVVEPYLPNKFI